jgi:cytochrome c oxidase assembly factor CtaG
VTAWTRLGFAVDAWTSTYGAMVLVKAGALLVLGGVGVLHRRRTVGRVVAGRRRAFVRLALVEVLLMSATVAIAVVLSRTAPPAGAGLAVDSGHGGSLPTVERSIGPLDLGALLTSWRPDALVVTAVAASAIGYLLTVRRVRRLGHHWPAARIGFALSGLGVVLYALCGGLGSYSAALLSLQVAQLMTMSTLAAYLLGRAEPLHLLRIATGGTADAEPSGPRWLADPVNAIGALGVLWIGVYATPLLDLSLRSAVVHLLVNLVALAVGMWVWSALRGDAAGSAARTRGDRALLLLVPAVLLGSLALSMWRAQAGLGTDWFEGLHLAWDDPAGDRRRAALVLLGFALPFLALSTHLFKRRNFPVETQELPCRDAGTSPSRRRDFHV